VGVKLEGEEMNKKDKELLDLRNIALSKRMDLAKIKQLSWNIAQFEKMYPIDGDQSDLENLIEAYTKIEDTLQGMALEIIEDGA